MPLTAMTSMNGSPPTEQRRTRKRKSYSCVPCRSRKKQCNRKVPGCSQCVERGEAELCRWGDERDDQEEEQGDVVTPQRRRMEGQTSVREIIPVENPSPASQADENRNLFDTLSRADIHQDVLLPDQNLNGVDNYATSGPFSGSSSKSIFSSERNHLSSQTSNASQSGYFPKTMVITCDQARHLIYSYQEQASLLISWVDTKAIWDGLDQAKSNDIVEIRNSKPDLFALISVVCASSLVLLPATYTICMGLISKSSELGSLLDRLEADAFSALDQVNMFSHPTLVGLQALSLYQVNLSPRVSPRLHISRMDEFIRASRRMGLDKLGSAQDDERLWLEEDMRQGETPSALPTMLSGFWAGETFLNRNKAERTRGRAIWCFAVAKEWVTSRISGSCMIHPTSFTTTQPTPYTYGDPATSQDEALIWSFMMSCSKITYKYFAICSEAQALGKQVDYDKILELDTEILFELERRPQWLRAETNLGHSGSDWRSIEAIMISSSFWNRMFALHRPFLALSKSEPEKYGLSSSRSFEYAMLCIRIMKEGSQSGILMLKQLTFHFRLLQAALVVITHLFLGHESRTMKETIAIHQDLQFAISTFKQLSIIDPGGFFHSQGEKLEVLLAKAARLVRQNTSSTGTSCALRDRTKWPPSILNQMQEPGNEVTSQELEILSNLDDQLLRLSQSWPLATEEQDNSQIWSDLFLLLDNDRVPV